MIKEEDKIEPSTSETSPPKKGKKLPKKERNETPSRPFWTTRIMAEDMEREILLETTLREMLLHLIFIALITIISVGMVTRSMYYLTRVMEQQFVEKEFTTVNEAKITFASLRTAADFWHYAESMLFDGVYWEQWYDRKRIVANASKDDQKILFQNQLLGVPRMRQLKVRNDSCEIHPLFRRIFLTCYAIYSREAEDRAPFGPANGTAWQYSTSKQTGSPQYWGRISSYDGGGYYQDFSLEREKTLESLKQLENNLWITRGTRVIFIDFSVFNGNVNLFAIIKLICEFPPTGGVYPSASIYSLKLLRYIHKWDYFVLGCEIIFVCFIIFYTLEEIRELHYLRFIYFKHFWNYIDVMIIFCGYSLLILGILRYQYAELRVGELIKQPRGSYLNFENVGLWQISFNWLLAFTQFIIYIKVFKYMNVSRTMGQLNNTLKRCAVDILCFSFMFFIVFFAFAAAGYLLFGTKVENFSSFGVAMFTLLRTILGDFDYKEIEEANRILAPIFFISYIFFVFFVLLNMFIAIINDSYTEVKTELTLSPDEMQMWEFCKRGFFNFLRKCGCKRCLPDIAKKKEMNEYNVTIEKIRGVLKACGFKDIEIEMFFARYNIDPSVDLTEFDINKFMANLEEKPEDKKDKRFAQGSSSGGVTIEDLMFQDQRLDEMERTISLIVNRLDALLKKLDTLENVRKIPKPPQ